MDKIKLIKNHLKKERGKLLKAIKNTKRTRDSAPSAMESQHDTTRNQAEKLVVALEEELKKTDELLSNITSCKLKLFEFQLEKNLIKAILVPVGMGGKEINGIKLISEGSPLGSMLKNKKPGDDFEFNNQKGRVLRVS
jgi:seryl-tRNA synthetase